MLICIGFDLVNRHRGFSYSYSVCSRAIHCASYIIPILKIHVALPVFMKCGAGQHKLKVYATNGRYIIRNGIIFGKLSKKYKKDATFLQLICSKVNFNARGVVI